MNIPLQAILAFITILGGANIAIYALFAGARYCSTDSPCDPIAWGIIFFLFGADLLVVGIIWFIAIVNAPTSYDNRPKQI